jgi:hypothetical protein
MTVRSDIEHRMRLHIQGAIEILRRSGRRAAAIEILAGELGDLLLEESPAKRLEEIARRAAAAVNVPLAEDVP